jgi:hypothetical protein
MAMNTGRCFGSLGFFYSKKIGAGQFGTFATISATCGLMHCSKQHLYSNLVCAREQNPVPLRM